MSISLSYPEAEKVAADVARGWTGLTGVAEVPKLETLADLVQRILRGADQVVAARETEWLEMSTAPTCGRAVGVEVDGTEMLAVYWLNWECWRELAADFRSVGDQIVPSRWRETTAEERARG